MFNKDFKYFFLISVIFIAACIETDIYLPAFTDMMRYFSISEAQIQSLLTWNFAGICIAGPFYGPISDAIGRKKPLMIALGLFLIGSIITLFASKFSWMLFGRVLQGLGSGGCFTLGGAIIFDVFPKEKALQALNKINFIIPIIMAVAPMVGGYLNLAYGFRSNFLAIAICVLISFVICAFFFDESLPQEKKVPFKLKKTLKDFKDVSLSLPFWQTTTIVCLLFAGYLTFLSGVSVLFVLKLGVRKEYLPWFQAALLGAWVVANLFFSKMLSIYGAEKTKKIGTALAAFGILAMIPAALLNPESPYFVTLAMMCNIFGSNWSQGVYFPEAMSIFPDNKGVTSSFITSARLLMTAIVVGIASFFYNGTIYPIAIVVVGVNMISLITIFFYERAKIKGKQSELLLEGFSQTH